MWQKVFRGGRVWGFTKSDDIERIHLKFCKRLLQVKINTCNVAVYGELGRYPLYINRYIKIIKFWFKILNNENIIMQIVYKQALHDCNKGYNNWVTNVKNMLNNYGFGYVFENPNVVQVNSFVSEFKCRLVDNGYMRFECHLSDTQYLQEQNDNALLFPVKQFLEQ